ncbi:MAG: DUF3899 domain-containing protein [Liquorilactobacillus ghanensis]|uniref:DUF3899 domain-containing protein n=1 Tax=Liquorilactobacillus ghanensis TaxID=399370 RepID=UPI0039ED874C
MNKLKKNYYVKTTAVLQLIGVIAAIGGWLIQQPLLFSNILFLIGLFLICISIIDVLLGAHLLAGWFRHKKKGETDEEYRKNKLNLKKVAELKNKPIQIHRIGISGLILGVTYIVLAIIITW